MAYKLSKSKRLIEQIELDDGTMIDVNINVGQLSMDFNKEYNKVLRAQDLEKSVENLEELGKVTIDFIGFVIGKENTNTLLEYYENNYMELLEMIVPFIEDCVKPAMIAYIEEKNKTAQTKYKQRKTK